MQEHVRTSTAIYVASACAIGSSIATYLLVSHLERVRHEAELEDARRSYRRKLADAEMRLRAAQPKKRKSTWTGAIAEALGERVGGIEQSVNGVGPDGEPIANNGPESSSELRGIELVVQGRNGSDYTVPDDASSIEIEIDPYVVVQGTVESSGESSDDGEDENQGNVRVSGYPHIISEEQFYGEKLEYQKISVTYYSQDKVLCDDKDDPVPDIKSTIGSNIEKKFGKKSNDPQIAHIRNNNLECDFEVRRDDRSYVEVVLGVLGYGNPGSSEAVNVRAKE